MRFWKANGPTLSVLKALTWFPKRHVLAILFLTDRKTRPQYYIWKTHFIKWKWANVEQATVFLIIRVDYEPLPKLKFWACWQPALPENFRLTIDNGDITFRTTISN